MRNEEGPTRRHCHECGRPIGRHHRGVRLCRDCESDQRSWRGDNWIGRKTREHREARWSDDSLVREDTAA
jgi:hypothetical protein